MYLLTYIRSRIQQFTECVGLRFCREKSQSLVTYFQRQVQVLTELLSAAVQVWQFTDLLPAPNPWGIAIFKRSILGHVVHTLAVV